MRSTGLFAGIHLAGNALLLWLGYYWLGLGESRAGALVGSLAVAAVGGLLACWLYGASFAFFSGGGGVAAAFRAALGRLAPLVAAALAVLALYGLLALACSHMDGPGFRLASWLTLKLSTPVKPAAAQGVFHGVFWVLCWMVAPVLIVPMGPAIVARGWAGFRAIGSGCRAGRRWLQVPALLLAAFWVPLKLIAWVPHMPGFGLEMASFVLRAAAACLLFTGGWLALAWAVSPGQPGRPDETGKAVVPPA